VRLPAALVAVPLFLGCAAGIVLGDNATFDASLRIGAASLLTLIAAIGFFADGSGIRCAVAIIAGCALSGTSLGLSAALAAYDPDLVSWFNSCDEACHDRPVLLEGVLREDGALSPAGVSLLLDARVRIDQTDGARRRTAGGVRLSVAGVVAIDLLSGWRDGRTIRAPVLLRRPTPYGDPGVPDDVRGLARRGVVLLGTVKSVDMPISGLEGALEDGVWFDGSSVEGFARIQESDMRLVLDPDTMKMVLAPLPEVDPPPEKPRRHDG